ncbi:MAG: hypothetical protein ACYDBJ_14000 [Aggregatilineales bacterium]
MKKRLLSILIVALVCYISVAVSAQASALPRYAVAFGYKGGTRIAVLETTGKWRLDDLPRAFFGQGDTLLITPVWSPDGQTAYINYAAEEGQYRYVYAYNMITGKQTPVVFLNKNREGPVYEAISVSPDGRYLWISRSMDESSRLIDTQAAPDKRVLAKIDCATEFWTWLPGKVLVTGILGCAYTNYLFDLKTGQTAFSYLQTKAETNLFGTVIAPAADQSFVLFYTGITLSKLSLETGQLVKWLDADRLSVSSDQKSAAFVHAGHLYTLDLRTLATADLGDIGPVYSSFTADNSLNFWTVEPENAPQTIRRVTVQAGRRADSTVYNAQAFKNVSFAPDGQGFMLDLGEKGGYQLYDADGKLTWRSLNEDPQIAAQLQFDGEDGWTGDWYLGRLLSTTAAGVSQRSFAINATTGKTLLAPEQAPVWLSAAPDNVWWLYAVPQCNDEEKSKLIAYNVETNETVTIAEGGVRCLCEEYLYDWSPILGAGP